MQQLKYSQLSGHLFAQEAGWNLIGLCYAGNGLGLNNPEMQTIHNVGPLPSGSYIVRKTTTFPHLGPIVFQLEPDPRNEMFGRAAFFIHWDTRASNFTASDGCIVGVMPSMFGLIEDGATLIVTAGD